MLVENFYAIDDMSREGGEAVFHVSLNPDCGVYEGHFPGSPVCPGVCSLQMVRECAERSAGKKLFLKEIKQCRYVTLMSPQTHPHLTITLSMDPSDDGMTDLQASVTSGQEVCLTLKALFE